MKYLFVGDIHNHKYIFEDIQKLDRKYLFDRIVCLGDYVDDWKTSNADSIATLNILLKLKQAQPDKYILLIGNHELSYLGFPCSGHDYNLEEVLELELKSNIELFNLSYVAKCGETDYLCTHAGITLNYLKYLEDKTNITDSNVLDELEKNKLASLPLLTVCSSARGGTHEFSSFVWCDLREHQYTSLINGTIYPNQIVGHTPVNKIRLIDSIYYIDTHSTMPNGDHIGNQSYLIWDEDKFITICSNEIKEAGLNE